MSLEWAKNLAGFQLNEDEMKKIPNPVVELGIHVTFKTVQAFGTIGTLVVGPIAAFRGAGSVAKQASRYGRWGVLLGLVTGPALTYARLRSIDFNEEAVYDRCYRIRRNRNQVRVDRASLIGMFSGAGLFSLMRMCPILGSVTGLSTGVVAAGVYNQLQDKK